MSARRGTATVLEELYRTRDALGRARERLKRAEEAIGPEAVDLSVAWAAAAEWTFWVVAFDELLSRELRAANARDRLVSPGGPDALTQVGPILDGVRYLRNLHAHQLSQTLEIQPMQTVRGPVPRLAWRALGDLPAPTRTRGAPLALREAYGRTLAGMPVGPIAQRVTIAAASSTWRKSIEAAQG